MNVQGEFLLQEVEGFVKDFGVILAGIEDRCAKQKVYLCFPMVFLLHSLQTTLWNHIKSMRVIKSVDLFVYSGSREWRTGGHRAEYCVKETSAGKSGGQCQTTEEGNREYFCRSTFLFLHFFPPFYLLFFREEKNKQVTEITEELSDMQSQSAKLSSLETKIANHVLFRTPHEIFLQSWDFLSCVCFLSC